MTCHALHRALVHAALLAALVLVACSTGPAVRTTHLQGDVQAPVAGGVTYYLPKRVLRLGIWATEEVPTDEELQAGEPPQRRVFATILEKLTIPDRNYLMHLTHEPSASFHDTIHVAISAEGLLTEVKTTVTDESPAIVAKLAELASAAAPIHLKASGARRRGEPRTTLLRTLVVDPTDPRSYELELANYAIDFRAEPTLAGAELGCTVDAAGRCVPLCGESGVCYRPMVPYHITLRPGGLELVEINQPKSAFEVEEGIEEIIMLPNRSPIVCLPIDRAPFVRSMFHATFDHGMLTSMASDKPSEILGFLEIPIVVARKIVGIPGELLQLRVAHYDRVQKAAAGEQAAFQAIEDLSKARQDGP